MAKRIIESGYGAVAAILLTWPILAGATCSPSEPGCEYDNSCEGIDRPARSCINFCAPLWHPSPSPEDDCNSEDDDADGYIDEACPPNGSPEVLCQGDDDDSDGLIDEGCMPNTFCPLDPCDEDAFEEPGAALCPDGYYCQELLPPLGDDRHGRCTVAEAGFGDECDPAHPAGPRCSQGTFCALADSERAQAWLDLTGADNDLGGVCLTPVREGSPCDSNMVSIQAARDAGLNPIAPCEAGTICLETEDSGQRCVRSCEDSEGVPSNAYCACGTSECAELESEVIDRVTGESYGKHFCTPCDSNFGTCSLEDDQDCCDPNAGCFNPIVDVPTDRHRRMCCWTDGTDGCEVGRTDQCCPGTMCVGGVCDACAREGDNPELGCCPGYTEFRTDLFSGATECRRCSTYGFTCSDERLDIVHEDGTVDNVTIPETDQGWYVDALGAGGNLTPTGASPKQAIYQLTDQHRAYLFPHDISDSPTAANWSALLLPQNIPGTERTESLPTSLAVPTGVGLSGIEGASDEEVIFRSARVYDIGSCSYLLRWPVLTNVLAMEVNKALEDLDWGGIFGATPFTPVHAGSGRLEFSVRPIPAAIPRVPLSLPRGPLTDDDRLMIHAEYISDSMLGCQNAHLYVDATVRIVSEPALLTTQKALDEDTLMAQVGCVIGPSGNYECVLPMMMGTRPERSVAGDLVLYNDIFPRNPTGVSDVHMIDDEIGVHCDRQTNSYRCIFPFEIAGEVLTSEVTFNRAMYESVEATDWSIELDSFNAYIGGVCALEDEIPGFIRPKLVDRLDSFRDRLDSFLDGALGDSFVNDFGVSPDDLAQCGNPMDGVEPLACQRSYQFGGRRHDCSTGVTDSTGSYVCDGANLEIRRMFVRPEGIGVVFAEGPDDPQHALLNGRPGLIVDDPTVSGDIGETFKLLDMLAAPPLDWAFEQDPGMCAADRWSVPLTDDTPLPRGVMDWYASTLIIPNGLEICDETDPSCTGICGQFGNECNQVRDLGLDVLLTGDELPDGDLICSFGQCVVAP